MTTAQLAPSPTAPAFAAAAANHPSPRVLELERTPLAGLEQIFLGGTTPDLDDLAGWEFRGLNSPSYFKLLGIKKFVKGFWRGDDGATWGYNYPVEQNPIEAGWFGLPSVAAPKRFGFYRVEPVDPTARDNKYLHAVLLDYGKGRNPPLDPSAGLRDYLVQLDRDLFLGKAYFALGPLRVPTASFFILERHQRGPARIDR